MDIFGREPRAKVVREPTRYLVVIRFGKLEKDEIQDGGTRVGELVTRLSRGDCRPAFFSDDRATIGMFMRAAMAAAQIRIAIEGLPIPTRGMVIWVLQLGQDCDGIGEGRGLQWLQHH